MSESDINTVTFKVKKGEKGRLITSHSNPRATVSRDHWDEFKTALGSEEKADQMVENFRRFNNAGDRDSIMADGIVFTLIHQHRLGRVVLLEILGIGTSRYKRIRDGHTKNIDYKHLNGFQVRFDDDFTLKFCVLELMRFSFRADHRQHGRDACEIYGKSYRRAWLSLLA